MVLPCYGEGGEGGWLGLERGKFYPLFQLMWNKSITKAGRFAFDHHIP